MKLLPLLLLLAIAPLSHAQSSQDTGSGIRPETKSYTSAETRVDARIPYFEQEYLAPSFNEMYATFASQLTPLNTMQHFKVLKAYTPEDLPDVRETVFMSVDVNKKPYQIGYARVAQSGCKKQKGELRVLATPAIPRPRLFTMPFDLSKQRPRDQLAAYLCQSF